ncbi:MAG: hypothetical protein EA379_05860 [Phycisphaerales bacterium]|nr:MAG: hypothetical protein EA379_05860 [Phycisphaerales bacterium]
MGGTRQCSGATLAAIVVWLALPTHAAAQEAPEPPPPAETRTESPASAEPPAKPPVANTDADEPRLAFPPTIIDVDETFRPLEDGRTTLGFAGASPMAPRNVIPRDTVALPDRWRIGWPSWDRYGRQAPTDRVLMNAMGGDVPFTLGHPLNPYDRNVLKGDYPIVGDDIFLNVTAVSDTLLNFRKLPTPSGVSASRPGSFDFFGDGEQLFFSQTALLSFDIFQGNTSFRPVDWLIRVSPAFNFNYLRLQEDNNVDIDVRKGDSRDDSHVLLQEAFFELHLGDTSHEFDFAAVRAGRQLFVSDFRGFIYNDIGDGVRLLGNLDSNRIQYNVAYFFQNEKDTNSGLSELDWRDQQVLIANLYIQDFIWLGYTTQFSFHWNRDRSGQRFDTNGFLVRPSLAGSVTLQEIDAFYLGWAGDGHIGRLNVNHAFYYVTGKDRDNPIAGRDVDINAFLGALELSVDIDWFRPKVSFLYASGDSDPNDGAGGGFDAIFDNSFFAGGPSSFYHSQAFRLLGVDLTGPNSSYNTLAGARAEGQANFVNPGTIIANAGFDAEITPRLRASFNANSIWMADTSSVELFLNQNDIDNHLGVETNLVLQWRPLLNNNIIITGGGSLFFPGKGFEDIYESDDTLWQGFIGLTLTF